VPPIRKLLADDNDEVLAAVREELGAEFEIIGTVANGQDAVEAVRLFDPDVVVMDIAMPILDGIGAAERICWTLSDFILRTFFMGTCEIAEVTEAVAPAQSQSYPTCC
jgi:CheY-like chemotaxis protein